MRQSVSIIAFLMAMSAMFGPAVLPANADPAVYAEVRPEKTGRIYHYLRSNRVGTEAERVSVFRRDSTHIEVNKSRNKCLNSALVTATVSLPTGQATNIVGGRLLRDAKHQEFAFLTHDPVARKLTARAELPSAEIKLATEVSSEPWHLYDFDLASLTIATTYLKHPEKGWSFDLPLLLVGEESGPKLVDLGVAVVAYVGTETYTGRKALRFQVAGPASGDKGGPLWLDEVDGHILGAEWVIPNHSEYKDFKILLTEIDDGGTAAWDSLLRSHFDGCKAK